MTWLPYPENKPDKPTLLKEYLVTVKRDDEIVVTCATWSLSIRFANDYSDYGGYLGWNTYGEVIAYRELPEPYIHKKSQKSDTSQKHTHKNDIPCA